MTRENPEAEAYKSAFIERTKELREARGWSQQRMAQMLGIPLENYKKYEQRTILPHYLIDRFAALVGRDISYVMIGEAANPVAASRKVIENIRRTK